MQAAPAGPCVQRSVHFAHASNTGQPDSRHSLRDGITAYTRSPRSAGLVSLRRPRASSPASLIPASGDQDHATSPSVSAAFVYRSISGHRIPAPRFVTIGRNVPLHRGGMRETIVVICPTAQAKRSATDWHDGQIVDGPHHGPARPRLETDIKPI